MGRQNQMCFLGYMKSFSQIMPRRRQCFCFRFKQSRINHDTITDYDTQSQYLSTVAEFFITPDGEECYIGFYYPANEGNGATVVLTPGNIFEEINNA